MNQLEFDLRIMASDVQKFKRTMSLEEINHSLPSHILLGLILNSAICINEFDLSLKIIDLIQFNEFSSTEIVEAITCIDNSGYSVMATVLYSGDQKIYDEMIELINNLNDFTKVNCIKRDLNNLSTIIRCPSFDFFEAEECIDEYLKPIYTEESIKSIIDLVK